MKILLVYPPDRTLPTIPFSSLAVLQGCLRAKGHTGARSDALAATVLATYEGATVMARAHRDAAVLQAAGRAMVELCTRVPDPGP